MAQGFGIAALVLAIAAIFIPFGIVISAVAVLCVIVAAVKGDRVFSIAATIIVLVNTFFLGPSTWAWLSGFRAGQFTTYALFSIGWPLLFAAIYWQLERMFPDVLVPGHKDELREDT